MTTLSPASSTVSSPKTPTAKRKIPALVIQVLLSLAFLAAATAKLAGVPMMVQIFGQIGLGQWFRYVTGLVEIAGVIMIWVPGFTVVGAAWLAFTMFCAVLTHLFVLHSNPAPAVVLLVLNLILLFLRRDTIPALRARFF